MARYPVESITRDDAKLLHPDADIEVLSIPDHDGEERLAIYVYRKHDTSAERVPYAIYWLERGA